MRAQPVVDLAAVHFLAPVAEPRKIICVGLNYRDHTEESGFERPAYPTLFSRFNTSVVPRGAPLEHAGVSDSLDFDGELVAVIGTAGSCFRHEDALSHVLAFRSSTTAACASTRSRRRSGPWARTSSAPVPSGPGWSRPMSCRPAHAT